MGGVDGAGPLSIPPRQLHLKLVPVVPFSWTCRLWFTTTPIAPRCPPGPWLFYVCNRPCSFSPTHFIEVVLSWVCILSQRCRTCLVHSGFPAPSTVPGTSEVLRKGSLNLPLRGTMEDDEKGKGATGGRAAGEDSLHPVGHRRCVPQRVPNVGFLYFSPHTAPSLECLTWL